MEIHVIPRRKAAPLDRLQKTNQTVSCSITLSFLEQKTKREGFSTEKPKSIYKYYSKIFIINIRPTKLDI
jgi:hypothetical protein